MFFTPFALFSQFFPHSIHVWYICLYIYHKNQLNVGKYTMGLSNLFIGSTVGSLPPFSQPQTFESETMTLVSLSIHSRSLTWPLKNDGWKITFLLGRELFRGYVKLQVGREKHISNNSPFLAYHSNTIDGTNGIFTDP